MHHTLYRCTTRGQHVYALMTSSSKWWKYCGGSVTSWNRNTCPLVNTCTRHMFCSGVVAKPVRGKLGVSISQDESRKFPSINYAREVAAPLAPLRVHPCCKPAVLIDWRRAAIGRSSDHRNGTGMDPYCNLSCNVNAASCSAVLCLQLTIALESLSTRVPIYC